MAEHAFFRRSPHHLVNLSSPAAASPTDADLLRQQQWVRLFSEMTVKIRQSLQIQDILRATVTEVQRVLDADRVLIYQVFADGTGKAISEAVVPEYPAILNLEFPEEVFPFEYQTLYARGRVRAIANVHDAAAGLAPCLVEMTDQFHVKAKLIVPILQSLHSHRHRLGRGTGMDQNQLWGLLIAHDCKGSRQWIDVELELMQQLAGQISIALTQAEMLEHLEEIVEMRTAELQATNHRLQREINDRMQAEAALRRSEEQLRLITNALPVLIAYVDAQQRYRFNNQAYEDWLGHPPQAMEGQHLRSVWGDTCYQRMQPHVEAAIAGQVVTYEHDISLKDGSCRSVSVTYIPHLAEEEGGMQVQGFFALTSDISDRKAAERLKDEFIAIVSHELRTPLTSLHSALKILSKGHLGSLSADGQQMLAIADDNTERLLWLVDSVLNLQRIEAGEIQMERRTCSATDLITQAVKAMQPMAQQHGVTLVPQPADIPLWVDPDYVVQTLTNLLSNAIKFSPSGGTVWLTAEIRRGDALFQVRDQGQGIPADKLEQIFERFQQVDAADARKKGGTGLGLTICRKIVEQHQGKIWAESILGHGSTLAFTLPVAPDAPSAQ